MQIRVNRVRVDAQIPGHQLRREPIEARWHSRVGREDIAGAGGRKCDLKRLARLHHEGARAGEHREGRMSFIQMANLWTIAEFVQQSPTTNAEHDLLE